MSKIFVLFILSTLLITPAFTTNVLAAEAATAVSVNQNNIGIAINGRGFGRFVLTTGVTGSEPSLVFQINDQGCSKVSGNIVYQTFNCSVTNSSQQEWTAIIIRTNTFAPGTYNIKLSDGNNFIVNETFRVGPLQPQSISVSISPTGPLKDDTDNQITISWQPVTIGTNFLIDTTIPDIFTLPVKNCTSSPCNVTTTIPKGAPVGTHRVTVTQDGNATNTGNTTFTIDSATITKPSTPTLGCTPDDIKAGKCTTSAGIPCPDGSEGIQTAIGCVHTKPVAFISDALRFIAGIAGGIAFLLMLTGAFQMITSSGNPETLNAGRERFTSAIIGLLFIIFSVLLLQIIGVDILGLEQYFR